MEKKFKDLSNHIINFRKASLNDITEILEFDSLENVPLFTKTKLEEEISSSKNCSIVAATKNNVIGYASMSIMYDHADILYVCVNRNFKRIGIAKELIDSLIEECKLLKLIDIFLEVRASNTPAISLYIKCGFSKISERINYYNNPTETAYILKRSV